MSNHADSIWTIRLASLATPERVRRYPATVAVVFLLVWLGGFLQGRQGGVLDAWGKFLGNDFVAFYTGGTFLLRGHMDRLYELSAQHAFQQSLTPVELAQTSPFINPPFATVLYAPFAAVGDYLWALLWWWGAGVMCIAVSIACLRRAVPGLSGRPAWHLWAIVGCAPPTLLWLGYGQATPWIMMIWCGVFWCVMCGREVRGAALLGLLAFKPQLALGWALVFMVQRRVWALCAGALVLGATLAVSVYIWPDAMWRWWEMRTELVEMLRVPSYPSWGVCSVYGFFNGLVYPFSPGAADVLTLVSSFVLGSGLVWLWWGAAREDRGDAFCARVAITLMCAPLLAVQYYTYDLMLGVVPVMIMVGVCHRRHPGKYLDGGPVLVWTAILYLASFVGPPLIAAQVDWMRSQGLTPWFIQPIPGLVLAWSAAVYRAIIIPTRASVVIEREDD